MTAFGALAVVVTPAVGTNEEAEAASRSQDLFVRFAVGCWQVASTEAANDGLPFDNL